MKTTITLVALLVLAVVATAAQKLEKNNPPALAKPNPGTYTHVVKSGKLLFIVLLQLTPRPRVNQLPLRESVGFLSVASAHA